MEATKIYQLEKFTFTENKDNVDSATIESWEDGVSSVTIFGIDGNTLYESSLDKINDDEYEDWVEPYLNAMNLL